MLFKKNEEDEKSDKNMGLNMCVQWCIPHKNYAKKMLTQENMMGEAWP